jgi:hypothetical protein
MKVPLHLYFSTERIPQIQNTSLLHPEILTASAPISHISIDPDTTTPFYKPRYALPPSSPSLLYPNPTSGVIYLLHPAPSAQISLYDSSGRLVWEKSCSESPFKLSLESLPAGLYKLLIRHNENNVEEKTIIKISP